MDSHYDIEFVFPNDEPPFDSSSSDDELELTLAIAIEELNNEGAATSRRRSIQPRRFIWYNPLQDHDRLFQDYFAKTAVYPPNQQKMNKSQNANQFYKMATVNQFYKSQMESFAIVRIMILVLVTIICGIGEAAQVEYFNVMDYGAKGDAITDDSVAFLKAWNDTCNSETDEPTMVIPRRQFFLRPTTFRGPCKSKVHFAILGVLFAPSGPKEWKELNDTVKFIEFEYVNGLYIHGVGLINGRGKGWWDISCRYHPDLKECGKGAPTALRFHKSNDIHMSQIRIIDSPQTHILLLGCNDVEFEGLFIKSPDGSPNTDGIHIQATNNVFINSSFIGSGDDCVSIGDGISNVNITYVTCGPGHGISIGSLGGSGNVVNVSNIHVRHAIFNGTQNGARIKTYQTGRGEVRDVEFSDIKFIDAGNPIIIDQYYCGNPNGCPPTNVGVQISNVSYTDMYGTSKADVAVNFNCSGNVACTDIKLENINLTSSTIGKQVTSSCNNAYGEAKGTIEPKSCLNSKT
ncbi:polygalacturonase-like [Quercus lobata]|uniref:polygalacturonase-like n=1 Tax=Quercus lobata TaxID=97700 RepID=UPI0012439E43|nr:polygalacturonase-like [Quercus lobata]